MCKIYIFVAENKNVLGIDFYLGIEQEREQRFTENGIFKFLTI